VYKTLGLWLINWASAEDGSPVFASDFAPWLFRNLSPLSPPVLQTHARYQQLAAIFHHRRLYAGQNHRLHHRWAIFILNLPHPTPVGWPPSTRCWNNINELAPYNARELNETWTYKQGYYYYFPHIIRVSSFRRYRRTLTTKIIKVMV